MNLKQAIDIVAGMQRNNTGKMGLFRNIAIVKVCEAAEEYRKQFERGIIQDGRKQKI